jgi:hypothetical protein
MGLLGGPYRDIARISGELDLASIDRLSQQMKGLSAAGLIGHDGQLFGGADLSSMFDPLPLSILSERPINNDIIAQPIVPYQRDSEEFYYNDWPANRPVKKGGLTCDRWRHQTGEEMFEFNVLFTSEGDARGVVECTVHADNLTKPAQSKIVVLRSAEQVSMLELAAEMLEACD